jgi:hypothetical protein
LQKAFLKLGTDLYGCTLFCNGSAIPDRDC